MKKWICHNLIDGDPDSVDSVGFFGSLAILSFLVGSWVYLFVVIPAVCF